MAALINQNFPHGFKPLMVDTAGAPVGVHQYAKPSSDANAIYTFDFLRKMATSAPVEGQLLPTASVQTFATATPGTTLIVGSSLNYGAASVATWHTVVDDPGALYEAQVDGTGAVTVAASVGKNANVNNTAQTSGSLISAMQVSFASIAVTAGLDLRIMDFLRLVTNSENPNAIVEVLVLKHAYAPGSAGV
jgi:hypothetical protein